MENINKIIPSHLHDDTGKYPSDESLEFIKKYDCVEYSFLPLAEFIKEIWWCPDWGYKLSRKLKNEEGIYIKKLHLSTGWSGNESILYALRKNLVWWSTCFLQHRRGGHYIFEIPIEYTK